MLQKPNTVRLRGLKQVYAFQRIEQNGTAQNTNATFSEWNALTKQTVAWVVLGHQVTFR